MSSTESRAAARIRGGRVMRERSTLDAASLASGMNSASATGGTATVTLKGNRNPGPFRYPLPRARHTFRDGGDKAGCGWHAEDEDARGGAAVAADDARPRRADGARDQGAEDGGHPPAADQAPRGEPAGTAQGPVRDHRRCGIRDDSRLEPGRQ